MLFVDVIPISSDSSSSESNDGALNILPGLLAWYYPEQHSDASTDTWEVEPIQAIEPPEELPSQAPNLAFPVQVQIPVEKAHKKKFTQDIVLGMPCRKNPIGFGAPSSSYGKGKTKMV